MGSSLSSDPAQLALQELTPFDWNHEWQAEVLDASMMVSKCMSVMDCNLTHVVQPQVMVVPAVSLPSIAPHYFCVSCECYCSSIVGYACTTPNFILIALFIVCLTHAHANQ